jgi:hypothetical protein
MKGESMTIVQLSERALDEAVAAYNATPGERPGMTAALTAVNLHTPENLKIALEAFRPRLFGIRASMLNALTAVLEIAAEPETAPSNRIPSVKVAIRLLVNSLAAEMADADKVLARLNLKEEGLTLAEIGRLNRAAARIVQQLRSTGRSPL